MCSKNKTLQFDTKTTIKSNLPEDAFVIREAKRILRKRMEISPTADNSRKKNIIEIAIDTTLQGSEHYTLKADKKGITIKGSTESALYRGITTLEQILIGDVCNTAEKRIGHIFIDDAPRYSHRAIMLDPARHFFPVKDVKFFIDQMAQLSSRRRE